MDNYIEHIVKVKQGIGAGLMKIIGTAFMVVGVLVALVLDVLLGMIPFILGLVITFVSKNCGDFEYEYEITNGDFCIDKIINKSSRKHVLDFNEENIKRIMPFDNPKFQNEIDRGQKVKDFTSGDKDSHNMWYGMIIDQGKSQFAVVIETDEKARDYIEQYFKKRIEK